MKLRIGYRLTMLLAGAFLVAPALVQAAPSDLEHKVRHELLMLPYYNVFDNLTFRVDGSRVTLEGQVTQPVLKSDAARVVKAIPGVTAVIDKIEVLPLSPFDDSVRVAVVRALYGRAGLSRYALGAQPSIRIVVKNGHVTLEGVVDSQFDRTVAGVYVNSVPGVFSVVNNLRVVKG